MKNRKSFHFLFCLLLLMLEVTQIVLLLEMRKNRKEEGQSRHADILSLDRKEFLRLWQEEARQLFYFRSDGCKACEQSDEDVTAYLEKGYGSYLPLYVIEKDLEAYEDLIQVTPTLILKEKEKMIRKEGAQEVFLLLNDIVHETD